MHYSRQGVEVHAHASASFSVLVHETPASLLLQLNSLGLSAFVTKLAQLHLLGQKQLLFRLLMDDEDLCFSLVGNV